MSILYEHGCQYYMSMDAILVNEAQPFDQTLNLPLKDGDSST